MSELQLHFKGDPVLVEKSRPVGDIKSDEFQAFLDDLAMACFQFEGVGLAAPQVGRSSRVFAMISTVDMDSEAPLEMGPEIVINPEILQQSKETALDWEGCLSVPGYRGPVPRSVEIEAAWLSRTGEKIHRVMKGYAARVFLHEYDHLEGVLFLDRMTENSRLLSMEEYDEMLLAAEEDEGATLC